MKQRPGWEWWGDQPIMDGYRMLLLTEEVIDAIESLSTPPKNPHITMDIERLDQYIQSSLSREINLDKMIDQIELRGDVGQFKDTISKLNKKLNNVFKKLSIDTKYQTIIENHFIWATCMSLCTNSYSQNNYKNYFRLLWSRIHLFGSIWSNKNTVIDSDKEILSKFIQMFNTLEWKSDNGKDWYLYSSTKQQDDHIEQENTQIDKERKTADEKKEEQLKQAQELTENMGKEKNNENILSTNLESWSSYIIDSFPDTEMFYLWKTYNDYEKINILVFLYKKNNGDFASLSLTPTQIKSIKNWETELEKDSRARFVSVTIPSSPLKPKGYDKNHEPKEQLQSLFGDHLWDTIYEEIFTKNQPKQLDQQQLDQQRFKDNYWTILDIIHNTNNESIDNKSWMWMKKLWDRFSKIFKKWDEIGKDREKFMKNKFNAMFWQRQN